MSDLILVTGAAGFIGSNLCHYLTSIGEEVIGLDGMFTGSNLKNLEGCNVKLPVVDLAEEWEVEDFFSKYPVTKIVHLAANSHVDRSISGDAEFWRSNVIGTSNLLRAALRAGNVEVVVNQITDEYYGEKPSGEAREGDPPMPTSPYPCSKTAQYFVGRSFWTTFSLPVISTFPVNCYGPRQWPEKLIPKFVTNLIKGQKIPLMASTHFERDWIPVIDTCRALHLLLDKGVPGEDYNIGADRHHTNLQMTHKLLALCGRDDSYIELVDDRAAHDCRYAVNSDKIKALGFQLSRDFDDYLAETVSWYKEGLCFSK